MRTRSLVPPLALAVLASVVALPAPIRAQTPASNGVAKCADGTNAVAGQKPACAGHGGVAAAPAASPRDPNVATRHAPMNAAHVSASTLAAPVPPPKPKSGAVIGPMMTKSLPSTPNHPATTGPTASPRDPASGVREPPGPPGTHTAGGVNGVNGGNAATKQAPGPPDARKAHGKVAPTDTAAHAAKPPA